MRHEILYQYDLPIEVLDDIPRTEEVLEVLYARSREKYLIPILFTRLRIMWAYPERQTVYRIYEMQYVDLLEAQVKYPKAALPAVLTLKNVSGDNYIFKNLKSSPEQMRGGLLTLRDLMMSKVGGVWELQAKQNLISDEYTLKESDEVLSDISPDDIFEDTPMPGQGCYESTEKLFSHFPSEDEPVVEENKDEVFEVHEKSEDEMSDEAVSPAMVSRVARMIESTEPVADEYDSEEPANDVVVFEKDSGKSDSQWDLEINGDAMILPGGRTRVGAAKYKNLENNSRKYAPEDDDSVVYVDKREEPPHPVGPVRVDSVTLEPKEGLDDDDIDKSLDALKYLRETGVITEDEYKARCLSLFKKTGL
ncbi:MAG: hypothetical protein Q4Q53_04890 [Methanocorpusculum sp.]|nr:hypothetical protein [Methanocorpusculum sp.]